MRVVKFRLSPPTLCRTAGMKREAVLSVTNHLRAWFGFHPRFKWGKPYLGGLILALWLQPVWATTKNSGEAYRQALQFLSQQNWKAAAAEFEECLRTDPHNAAAYDGLGVALIQLGKPQDAEKAFGQAVHINPSDARAHYYLGVLAADSQDAKRAVKELQTSLKLQPRNLEARLALALAYQESNDLDKAVAEYKAALSQDPQSAEAHNGLGNVYVQKNDVADAIKEYRRAVSLKPDYFRAYNNLGSTLAGAGDTQGANQALEKALALRPRSVEANLNLGLVLSAQGDSRGALRHFRTVLTQHPPAPVAYHTYYAMAQSYRQMGDLPHAVNSLIQALRLRPDMGQAYYSLGSTLKQMASVDRRASVAHAHAASPKVNQLYNHARELTEAGNFADAHYNLGVALWYSGHHPESIAELQRAVQLDPADGEAYAFLGMALKEAGRYEEALANLDCTLSLNRDYFPAYIDQAVVLMK